MDPLTKTAISATLHCLTGCAIGEVLGMVIGTALNWHNAAVTALSIVLAFVFGYALTTWTALRHGLGWKRAVSVALAADTVSITSMELVDNGFIWLVPGAVSAMLTDILFWWSLLISLLLAFILTVPVNRFLIARGKGHAAVHDMHHH
jgi:uncharacterized membrane protein YagU involved in acid resistance